MADEIEVGLTAVDNISGPAEEAAQALEGVSGAARDAAEAAEEMAAPAANAERSLMSLGESGAFRRFDHLALRMMIGNIAEMEGVAGKGSGSLRLLEGGLSAVAMTAGLVTGPMLLVVAGIAAMTAAWKTHSAEAEKAKKAFDDQIASLKGIAPVQVDANKATFDSAAALRKQLEAQLAAQEAAGTYKDRIIAAYREVRDVVLKVIEDIKIALNAWVQAQVSVYKAIGDLAVNILHPMEGVHKAQADLAAGFAPIADGIQKVAAAANNWLNSMPSQVDKTKQKIKELDTEVAAAHKRVADATTASLTGMQQNALTIFSAIGNSAVQAGNNMVNAWQTAFKAVDDMLVQLATSWIQKHIVMAEASEVTHNAELGIFGVISGGLLTGAVAAAGSLLLGALSGSTGFKGAGAGGGGGGGGGGGIGGSPVSSANSNVTNQITINLPIQALDLASISDSVLRGFAVRVGAILRDAAATGQFALQ